MQEYTLSKTALPVHPLLQFLGWWPFSNPFITYKCNQKPWLGFWTKPWNVCWSTWPLSVLSILQIIPEWTRGEPFWPSPQLTSTGGVGGHPLHHSHSSEGGTARDSWDCNVKRKLPWFSFCCCFSFFFLSLAPKGVEWGRFAGLLNSFSWSQIRNNWKTSWKQWKLLKARTLLQPGHHLRAC